MRRKLFSLFLMLAVAVSAWAQSYKSKGSYVSTCNTTTQEGDCTVGVVKSEGTFTVSVPGFNFKNGSASARPVTVSEASGLTMSDNHTLTGTVTCSCYSIYTASYNLEVSFTTANTIVKIYGSNTLASWPLDYVFTGDPIADLAGGGSSPEPEGPETTTLTYKYNGATSGSVVEGASIKPTTTTNYGGTLSYASNNTDVATVSADGTITGVAPGTATITVTAAEIEDEYTAAETTFTVTVTEAPKDGLSKAGAIDWNINTEYALTANTSQTRWFKFVVTENAHVTIANTVDGPFRGEFLAADGTAIASSPNDNIKKLEGDVTPGTYYFRLTYLYYNRTFKITVVGGTQETALTYLYKGKNSATISLNKNITPVTTVTNGYDGTISYSSSDEDIVAVNPLDGTIYANSLGTATITVTAPATSGFTEATTTFTVTVVEKDGTTKEDAIVLKADGSAETLPAIYTEEDFTQNGYLFESRWYTYTVGKYGGDVTFVIKHSGTVATAGTISRSSSSETVTMGSVTGNKNYKILNAKPYEQFWVEITHTDKTGPTLAVDFLETSIYDETENLIAVAGVLTEGDLAKINASTTLTTLDFCMLGDGTVEGLDMANHPNCLILKKPGLTIEGIVNNIVVYDDIKYVAENLVLTDKKPFGAFRSVYAKNATYTRSMSNNWGTLMLPYAVQSSEAVKLYQLTGADTENGKLTFTSVDQVSANTPCVFRKLTSDGTVSFTPVSEYNETTECNVIEVAKSSEIVAPDAVGDLAIRGTFSELTGQTGMYFIAQDKFYYAEDDITIAPFRAWFETSAGSAKTFTIEVEGETDAILAIDADGNITEGEVYNLAGQRLAAPKKGQVNIINGKKVMIK